MVKVEHYPPKRELKSDEIKSVNGCGDSFVAGWVAAMLGREVRSGKEEDVVRHRVGVAQRAASLTLRCEGSVSGELRGLGQWLEEKGREDQRSDVGGEA